MSNVIKFPSKKNKSPKLIRSMLLLDQLIPYIRSNGSFAEICGSIKLTRAYFVVRGQAFSALLWAPNGKPQVEVWCETQRKKIFSATRAPFECWNLPTSAVLDDLLKAIHATNTPKSA